MLKFYGHIHYRYRQTGQPFFQEQVLLMRNTEPVTHAATTVCSGRHEHCYTTKFQPVEFKDAATQDNETTSGAKAGTESHRPADGLEDNLTTNWPPALGQSAQSHQVVRQL